jgi:hypothetical protein
MNHTIHTLTDDLFTFFQRSPKQILDNSTDLCILFSEERLDVKPNKICPDFYTDTPSTTHHMTQNLRNEFHR